MNSAIPRIESLLATGYYALADVRELPPIKIGGPSCWAAVLERRAGDPDDTYESVLVELKTPEEKEWAREKLQAA